MEGVAENPTPIPAFPLKGKVRIAQERLKDPTPIPAFPVTPIPIPTFPLKGKVRSAQSRGRMGKERMTWPKLGCPT